LIVSMFSSCVAFIARTSIYNAAMREAYILRQSVKEIFSTLRALQPLPFGRGRMVQALASSFPYFIFILQHADDPVSALHQALRAHALETVVHIGPLEPPEVEADIHEIPSFLKILYHHLVHDKILTYACKHVDAWSDALGSMRDKILAHGWPIIEQTIRSYAMFRSEEMIRQLSPGGNGWVLQCYCSGTAEDIKLMQCAGCQVVRYCSKRCQRDSWYSRHRLSCKFLKAAVGSSTPHYVKRSLRLLAALEDSQMQNRWDNIRKLVVAAQCEYPEDRERLVVEVPVGEGKVLVRPFRHYLSLFDGLSENEVVDRLSSWPDPRGHLRRSFFCSVITINDRYLSRQILFSPRTALDMETVSANAQL
ncbi:hypothetical protein EDB19DRAFT_1746057, partial [Suillus lakei]